MAFAGFGLAGPLFTALAITFEQGTAPDFSVLVLCT